MNALQVETCMLYMYFKETSLISHASLESSNKESSNQSKLSQKSATCSRRSPWLRIVLVRSLRSALLATAWLVKSMTYFDLIGQIGRCGIEFQHAKYKFSSHPKALELMAWHTPSGLVLGLCLVLMLCWGWDLPAVWRRHSPWCSGQALLGGAGHVVEQGWF